PSSDRIPHGNCSCRGSAPGPCITDNPADQTSVRSRDPVVFVYIQLCQRTDINLKLPLIRKSFGKLWIQAVNSLNHKNIPALHFQLFPFVFPLSREDRKSVV